MKTLDLLLGLSGVLSLSFAVGCTGSTETVPNDAGADGSTVVLDGGGTVAPPPNGAVACPQDAACNYQTNAGCDAQEACVPASDGAGNIGAACLPAGTGQSGDACSVNTGCASGFVCASSVCRKLCCGGDWSVCPGEQRCFREIVVKTAAGEEVDTGAMLCSPPDECDPLVPTSCLVPGTSCLIVDGTGATGCIAPGEGEAGDACPCKGGFVCVEDEGAEVCRQLCKAVEGGGEPGCEAGELCVHFVRDPPGVGECTPKE